MSPIIRPISVVLKEARQNKGISLDEAYKATKIHPKILRALEEGTTLGLSYVYVKSYIKIYAKYLGISQQELDRYFQPETPKEKKVHLNFHLKNKGDKIKSLSNLDILYNLGLQVKRYKKIIIIFTFVLVLALISLLKSTHRKDIIPKEKAKPKSSSIILESETAKTKPTESKKESLSKIDILRLTIFALEDTWIEVKVDGKVAFKRVLHKGSSETWQAKDKFELWLNNAGTVKLELNGNILPPIGRKGQSLKGVLINKDSLTIKK